MLANTGIKERVQAEICQFAEKYQLDKVVLFGSRARGDYHRASDIDLAVWGGNIARFTLDVDDETSTLLKYDVVDMSQDIYADLLASVQKEGRILYEKV